MPRTEWVLENGRARKFGITASERDYQRREEAGEDLTRGHGCFHPQIDRPIEYADYQPPQPSHLDRIEAKLDAPLAGMSARRDVGEGAMNEIPTGVDLDWRRTGRNEYIVIVTRRDEGWNRFYRDGVLVAQLSQ